MLWNEWGFILWGQFKDSKVWGFFFLIQGAMLKLKKSDYTGTVLQ